jgi:hypothetical protein
LLDLGQFLIARGSNKMTTVLIVDEAHHLSADILEEVRLLSNLETDDDKLLQIVLVGQPDLNDKPDSVGLRQLKQRIAVRSHLGSRCRRGKAIYSTAIANRWRKPGLKSIVLFGNVCRTVSSFGRLAAAN